MTIHRLLFSFAGLCALAAAQTSIDFSFAGYGGGGASIPIVPAVVSVRPSGADETAILQAALDRVASLPLQANGFRGAVLLRSGRHLVDGHLEMRAAGVVLRGEANTSIIATGKARRTLITIGARSDDPGAAPVPVTDETVAAGGRVLTLESVADLKAG
ncbi:MAG TPA: hypothetical protein VG273_05215, partial [Bryobacteraceae bacterium]|nr:hypothetical protein [Bryobacteraceae bacterium]